jgi:hypothetical protein
MNSVNRLFFYPSLEDTFSYLFLSTMLSVRRSLFLSLKTGKTEHSEYLLQRKILFFHSQTKTISVGQPSEVSGIDNPATGINDPDAAATGLNNSNAFPGGLNDSDAISGQVNDPGITAGGAKTEALPI